MMMAFLRKILGANVEPVTHENVAPAPRDHEKEREIKVAQNNLARAIVRVERRSVQIREELAGNVLSIVSGDR